ncbi:cytochrome c oxidase subunit II [Bacteroidota bacterium]
MLQGPTQHVETVDTVMLFIIGVSVIMLLGITITMIYFVIKYNRKKGHKPVDIHGSVLLETIWIVIPLILVLAMFYFGYRGYSELRRVPENSMEVKVTAQMWKWNFVYENGKKTDSLFVPLNQPVKLVMQSVDVTHSLFIPAFRIKEDVLPGQNTYLAFTPNKLGEYDIACAEFCGLEHSMMYTKVIVMPGSDFQEWYTGKPAEVEIDSAITSLGIENDILRNKGCITCHSLDGSDGLGPTFKGIHGQEKVIVTDGVERKIVIDEEYIEKSITEPFAEIVKGYDAIMPEQEYNLNEDELSEIVEILKGL